MIKLEQKHERENKLDPRVESLAIPLARDYAEKNYAKIGEDENDNSVFEPAWRGVNGEKWLKNKSPEEIASELVAEGWIRGAAKSQAEVSVIDIANQSYDEYSDYWKEQNRGGAKFLISVLDERGSSVISGLDLTDPKTRSEYGTLIHDAWIANNEWVKDPEYGNPELAKPFSELSDKEAQKDIDQLAVLQAWLADSDNIR